MKRQEVKKLNIGDILYHYVSFSGVLRYEVYGVNEYKDFIQYELRSLSCNHPGECRVLVAQDRDYKQEKDPITFKYISMVDEDEEDEGRYVCFHKGNYFLTSQEAIIDEGNEKIAKKEERINKLKERLEGEEKRLKELEDYVESVKNELRNEED